MSDTVAEVPRTTRVGFIGLGSQGGPIARRIVGAGFPTTLWGRRPQTLEPFRNTAATFADSPAVLAARVDIACVCVVDDADVEQVVTGPAGLLTGMARGGVIVIHSTVHPDTCRQLAQEAAARGIALIDAPVSGGGMGAEAGRLLVMVGADVEPLERCRPVFETFGNPIVHLGPVGAGQRAKLVNNLLLTANLGVLESAYELARGLDVEPASLQTVLAHGSGGSFAVGVLPGPDYKLAPLGTTAAKMLQKDARLVVELARAAGVPAGQILGPAEAALTSMGLPTDLHLTS